MKHDVRPRSRDIDEDYDPLRTHRCVACGEEGPYDDLRDGDCGQPPLFDQSAA